MTNTCLAADLIAQREENNVIAVDFGRKNKRTTSLLRSDGVKKASAADPVRDPEDIKRIQQYFKDKHQERNYCLFTLGIMFGLRASDLLNMKMSHFFNEDGTWKTHCNLYEKKTRKFNNPLITQQAREILSDYLRSDKIKRRYDDFIFLSRQKNPDGTLRPIDISQLDRIFKKVKKELQIPGNFSSHSMRKTFVYHMIKANPDDGQLQIALQKMLNHSSFKTTLIYCGLEQDVMDTYRTGLEQLLF